MGPTRAVAITLHATSAHGRMQQHIRTYRPLVIGNKGHSRGSEPEQPGLAHLKALLVYPRNAKLLAIHMASCDAVLRSSRRVIQDTVLKIAAQKE